MPALSLRGFGWRYAGRKAWAVRGVDLVVERGERVLLLGPSGAGKSTLLLALAGLLATDSGEQEGELSVPGQAGIVFQDPQSQLVMARAGDDVAFGLENLGVPAGEIWPRVEAALGAVGFRYGLDRPAGALSGGEQQRLALAGALAMRPGLLLLDEPTANLDPAGAGLVREAMARVLAGRDTTLVLVEHRVAEALPLVDRVVVLAAGGGVVADGPPSAIFAAHGERLAAQGVWVPGHPVPAQRAPAGHAPVRKRSAGPPGARLLAGTDVGFRHPRASTPALSHVDITVAEREAVAVIGANGSGKTTLALLLGGLLRPSAGTVTADRWPGAPDRWPAATLAGRIGSVFQNPQHQFVTARVDEELAIGARRAGAAPGAVKSTVDDLLARLRLDRLAAANPYTLSGGEQRRLSVATALATSPAVLVLDEPSFGQDRRTWLELVDLLAKLRDDGAGIVVVTHDEQFAASLADRTVALCGGGGAG
jgi:energy-coupling factor transport system ATP-binding protein